MATATLPLNSFKTKALELTTATTTVYTTPSGVTTIVLGAPVKFVMVIPVTVKFALTLNGTEFILLRDFEIPANDAADVITGKLVIPTGGVISASAGANNGVNLVFSILETSNE